MQFTCILSAHTYENSFSLALSTDQLLSTAQQLREALYAEQAQKEAEEAQLTRAVDIG